MKTVYKDIAKMIKQERDRIYHNLATDKTQTELNHTCAQHSELNTITVNLYEILESHDVNRVEFMELCGIEE